MSSCNCVRNYTGYNHCANPYWYSRQPKHKYKYFFKDCAIFFFLCMKNQANQLNMQIKLSFRYFDYESISSTFYARIFCTKVFFCHNVTREEHLRTENGCVKCWWNWLYEGRNPWQTDHELFLFTLIHSGMFWALTAIHVMAIFEDVS